MPAVVAAALPLFPALGSAARLAAEEHSVPGPIESIATRPWPACQAFDWPSGMHTPVMFALHCFPAPELRLAEVVGRPEHFAGALLQAADPLEPAAWVLAVASYPAVVQVVAA